MELSLKNITTLERQYYETLMSLNHEFNRRTKCIKCSIDLKYHAKLTNMIAFVYPKFKHSEVLFEILKPNNQNGDALHKPIVKVEDPLRKDYIFRAGHLMDAENCFKFEAKFVNKNFSTCSLNLYLNLYVKNLLDLFLLSRINLK